jgi:H+-transporting ATPase
MKEKKKHDELLAETPEAWRQASASTSASAQLDKADNRQSELRDLIARRAYEIYEERGRSDGEDMNDWLRAEAEVKASFGASDQEKPETARQRRPAISRIRVGQ